MTNRSFEDVMRGLESVVADNAINSYRCKLAKVLTQVGEPESHIEQVMLAALVFSAGFDAGAHSTWEWSGDKYSLPDATNQKSEIKVYRQAAVDKYRADFLLAWKFGDRHGYLAIECDGHQYHDATKEQASRDRARDRLFQSLGVVIFRFTGRDLWQSAYGCQYDIAMYLYERRNA